MKIIQVDSTIENLSSVMEFINSELDDLHCPEQIRAKIKLAIDELFGNICFYAYDPIPGPVKICLESETDPPAVVISFTDKGNRSHGVHFGGSQTTSSPFWRRSERHDSRGGSH